MNVLAKLLCFGHGKISKWIYFGALILWDFGILMDSDVGVFWKLQRVDSPEFGLTVLQ